MSNGGEELPIIDQFILDSYQYLSDQQMSLKLGIATKIVASKRFYMGLYRPSIEDRFGLKLKEGNLSEEMAYLVKFVEERKTGIWVDIARQRLEYLQKLILEV